MYFLYGESMTFVVSVTVAVLLFRMEEMISCQRAWRDVLPRAGIMGVRVVPSHQSHVFSWARGQVTKSRVHPGKWDRGTCGPRALQLLGRGETSAA